MSDTAFRLDEAMEQRRATIHQRRRDGVLEPLDLVLPQDPEVHMGGHGLYSTVGDYTRFLRMWLNDGMGDHGRVLEAGTVERAVLSGLDGQQVTMLPGVEPELSNDAEFFPGQRKSWAYTSWSTTSRRRPPAGGLARLGWLANLYYWIDRQNGIAGMWAAQVLPFADRASLDGYLEFEAAAYRTLGP